jgi:excisionase family DNA binding protein
MSTPSDGLLTVGEGARFLSISVSTLYGWVYQRRIPFVKIGRALRFRKCDLEKLILTNRHEAEARFR